MLIECSRCGAPLDVPQNAKIVRCNYCKSSHNVQQTRTIAAHTPQGWQPPQTWMPPQQAPHPSRPLNYHKASSSVPLVLAVVGVAVAMAMGLVMYLVAGRAASLPTGGLGRVAPAALAKAELSQSPATFIETYGGEQLDSPQVRLYLSGGPFELAIVGWNDERSFITSVTLVSIDKGTDTGAIVKALKEYLGPHFETEQSYSGAIYPGGAMLQLSADGSTFQFRSPPKDDARTDWQARARALWTVVANVGLGGSRQQGPGERELLMGHPLSALAKIDPTVVVDQAEAHVRSVFPDVVAEQSSDLELQVLSDHPWFGSVTLEWENKAGAHLKELRLWNPANSRTLTDPAGIARCLTPILGPPEERVTDHLKQTKSYQWKGTSYWEDGANMGTNNISFHMPQTPEAKQRLESIVTGLDRCGRLK